MLSDHIENQLPVEEPSGFWDNITKLWEDLWAGITENFDDFLKEQQEKLLDWFQTWWQEQQKKFVDFIEKQLINLINECCGSIVLVPLSLAIFMLSRFRR